MKKQANAKDYKLSRRGFIKTSAAAGMAASLIPALKSKLYAAGSDVLKVGLIGCGGKHDDCNYWPDEHIHRQGTEMGLGNESFEAGSYTAEI